MFKGIGAGPIALRQGYRFTSAVGDSAGNGIAVSGIRPGKDRILAIYGFSPTTVAIERVNLSIVDGAAGASPITLTGLAEDDTILQVVALADVDDSPVQLTLTTGAAGEGDITVAGLATTDTILKVFNLTDEEETDLTGLVISDGKFKITGSTEADTLLVQWVDASKVPVAEVDLTGLAVTDDAFSITANTEGKKLLVQWVDDSAGVPGDVEDFTDDFVISDDDEITSEDVNTTGYLLVVVWYCTQ